MTPSSLTWQKSTYSQDSGDCVELTAHGATVLLRESDNPAIVLTTTRTDLARFLSRLKSAHSAQSAPPAPAASRR